MIRVIELVGFGPMDGKRVTVEEVAPMYVEGYPEGLPSGLGAIIRRATFQLRLHDGMPVFDETGAFLYDYVGSF